MPSQLSVLHGAAANDAPVTRDELMQELLDRGISSRRGIMAIHRESPYRSEQVGQPAAGYQSGDRYNNGSASLSRDDGRRAGLCHRVH